MDLQALDRPAVDADPIAAIDRQAGGAAAADEDWANRGKNIWYLFIEMNMREFI
jgi:hypothetical protein